MSTTPDTHSSKAEDRHPCEATLKSGGPWNRHTYACDKTGKVERDGKWYCGTHDPDRRAAKQAERDAERERKWAETSAKWKLEAAASDLLKSCVELHRIVLNGMQDDHDEIVAALGRARAAIAKAEGK